MEIIAGFPAAEDDVGLEIERLFEEITDAPDPAFGFAPEAFVRLGQFQRGDFKRVLQKILVLFQFVVSRVHCRQKCQHLRFVRGTAGEVFPELALEEQIHFMFVRR